jgi:hypothetical protein
MEASGSPLAVGLCVPQDDGVRLIKSKFARTCDIHPNLFDLYAIPSVFHPFSPFSLLDMWAQLVKKSNMPCLSSLLFYKVLAGLGRSVAACRGRFRSNPKETWRSRTKKPVAKRNTTTVASTEPCRRCGRDRSSGQRQWKRARSRARGRGAPRRRSGCAWRGHVGQPQCGSATAAQPPRQAQ